MNIPASPKLSALPPVGPRPLPTPRGLSSRRRQPESTDEQHAQIVLYGHRGGTVTPLGPQRHDFLVEACDVPIGLTLAAWRARNNHAADGADTPPAA